MTAFSPTTIHIKRRTVLLPAEHGAWAQMIEALVLGLVVCLSVEALWAGAIVLLLGLCAQPVKLMTKEAAKPQQIARARAALKAFALFFPLSMLLLVAGLLRGILNPALLCALGLASVLGILQWRYALNHQARDLPSVFFGVLAMALVAPVMILANSGGFRLAAAAALVFIVRQFPTVFYTRYILRHVKKHPTSGRVVILIHFVALMSLALLCVLIPYPGLAGIIIVAAYLVLCLRAGVVMFLAHQGRRFNPKQLGLAELPLAIAYALMVGGALYFSTRGY